MKKFGEYIVDDKSIFCGEHVLIAREQDLDDLEKAIKFINLGESEHSQNTKSLSEKGISTMGETRNKISGIVKDTKSDHYLGESEQ